MKALKSSRHPANGKGPRAPLPIAEPPKIQVFVDETEFPQRGGRNSILQAHSRKVRTSRSDVRPFNRTTPSLPATTIAETRPRRHGWKVRARVRRPAAPRAASTSPSLRCRGCTNEADIDMQLTAFPILFPFNRPSDRQ